MKYLKSKLTAYVQKASIHYEGSITLPKKLCEDLWIDEYECVDVNNMTNGNRIQTYVLFGDSVQINGAAARLFKEGDIIHVNSWMDSKRWEDYLDGYGIEREEYKPLIEDLTK